mmetsp:Transcript_26497/g.39355  ORF Transcript_26497/g.39355 Transcript_26497/m.39355 type:complete len:205 (-) Transcript_26497:90-704(-)|eukprot:CAMPEP_0185020510 /NCGR_PEP_ID=MMETSP1103-20130426/3101_1 /TAXON_ID=36769 /ORGANISM="Paraphysomonas bandaiensis, Strain Caron Lab Isolate" /LENGTH=204 /DNA_ID=CAMNT_0027551445 /DNA_START=58 /DNA_END=672 /DNA_ORIENTATION=+
MRHNNVVPNQHFHKDWDKRVKTWFQQPIQKKIRRERRKLKAARLAPRPASGPLRPLVHCPTQKYSSKVRTGRGFTLEELKEAGISAKLAQTIGIAVDHRRTNKSVESLQLNVQRLKEYKSRLIVFPRKSNKPKAGDSSKEELAQAQQIKGDIVAAPAAEPAVTFGTITDEMKAFKAYGTMRAARNDVKLLGKRLVKAKAAEGDK